MAPQEISSLLKLYEKHHIKDSASLVAVRSLIKHTNPYVVNLAKAFLSKSEKRLNQTQIN